MKAKEIEKSEARFHRKKSGGMKPYPVTQLRSEWVQVRVSAREKRGLIHRANQAGFKSLSAYLRFLGSEAGLYHL